jgi:capsular polysaccharide biosynthesis protein
MLFFQATNPIRLKINQLISWLYGQIRGYYKLFRKFFRQLLFQVKILQCQLNSKNPATQERLTTLRSPKDSFTFTKDWAVENSLFKTDVEAEFISIEPDKEIVFDSKPTALDQHRSRLFEVRARKYTLCELFVLRLSEGIVWGRNGDIITPDNYLLEDLSIDYSRYSTRGYLKHVAFRDWNVSSIKRLSGRVAVLTHPASNIYFHWLLEVLPRIELLNRVGYQLEDFDAFVFTSTDKTFQQQTLSMLGIPDHKIVTCNQDMRLQADELVIPSQLVGYQKWLGFRDWVSEFVCDFVSKSDCAPAIKTNRRIYICRGKAKFRKVLNEDAIIQELSSYGFVPIYLENHSLPEQKAIMESAEVIVSPHGSGLTNLVFCQPHTKVIEIFPPELIAPEYCRLSLLMNLNYYYLFGEGKIADDWHKSKQRGTDILVNLSLLTEILDIAEVKPV